MSNASGSLPPAGWYPDPYGAPFERWWDGAQWTLHTTEGQPPVSSQPSAPAAPAQAAQQQPVEAQPVQPVQPVQAQPVQPVQAQPVQPVEPVTPAATPTPLEYPAPAVTPQSMPADQNPAAYDFAAAFEQPEPQAQSLPQQAASQPSEQLSPGIASIFGGQQPAFGGQQPADNSAAMSATPASATPTQSDDPFDFGFGGGATASAATPAAASAANGPVFGTPAESDSGLFGSWEPEEYEQPVENRPASASLVLGILSFFLSGLTGLIGFILGIVGLIKAGKLDREGFGPAGRGKAIGGIVTSVIGSAVSAAILLTAVPLILLALAGGTITVDGDSTIVDNSNLTINGGQPLEVGATGVINYPDTENPAVQFTVTSITRDPACTADEADVLSPENGQFVAVAMTFVLDPDYLSVMTSGGAMRVSTDSWIGFLADGSQVISTDAGNSCNTAAEQIPELTPGSTVSGTIILDLTADTTALSWSPSDVTGLEPGITRWEWALPVS